MSSIAPLTISGTSQYSSDFQNILNRTVQIAQIPVTALQNRDSDLLQQKSLLGGLSTAVGSLASSLQALSSVAASQALSATSSDSTVVTATSAGATTPTNYTINSVTSIASVATERSLNPVADSVSTPVSSTGTVDLVVGTTHNKFTLTSNNLVGLRDQINGLGAKVSATILTTSGGNYLSLTANKAGATTLKLVDDPTGAATNLLTQTNQGSDAVFQLNGITIHQQGNTINNVIPGVVLNLQKASTTPVTVSLASDGSQLASALAQFVTGYNALHSQLTAQVGPNAGQLSGDANVAGLQQLLRQTASYRSSSGSVTSLADLGITFDASGTATFHQDTFSALSDSQLTDAFKFVGSARSGLGAFANSFTQYSDPIDGLLKLQQDGIDRTDKSIQSQISTLSDRINAQQAILAQRLAAADAFESQLQSQQQSLTASLQGLNLVLYGKSANS